MKALERSPIVRLRRTQFSLDSFVACLFPFATTTVRFTSQSKHGGKNSAPSSLSSSALEKSSGEPSLSAILDKKKSFEEEVEGQNFLAENKTPQDGSILPNDDDKLKSSLSTQPEQPTSFAKEKENSTAESASELEGKNVGPGTTSTKKPGGAASLFPRHLRRLIVRRSDIYAAASGGGRGGADSGDNSTTSLSSPTDLHKLVGTYKRTPVAQSEIRDSYGQLILKPASVPSSKSLFRHHQLQRQKLEEESNSTSSREWQLKKGRLGSRDEFSVGNTQFLTTSLPLLNVSVMLDPTRYIKSMEANMARSGTEAARRILRGRKEWYKTVRKHAERGLDPSSIPLWPRHGVPRELLQDHIDYAGSLLSQNQATSLMLASRDSIRVRRPDGSHHNVPVPEDSHSLELYMAVMERITRTLSIVLQPDPSFYERPLRAPDSSSVSVDLPFGQLKTPVNLSDFRNSGRPSISSSSVDSLITSTSSHSPMWHVEFTRGWVVAEPILNQLEPVVEWVWPRQIFIRLRGRPKNNPRMAVALAYDTTFPATGK
ncbi:hypothetical protein ACA910_016769 [Epithemia clementina (nom. ined.)]